MCVGGSDDEIIVMEELESGPSKKITRKIMYRVLFPWAHFRQVTDGRTFDVFAYPLCNGNLIEYIQDTKPSGEEMRNIFVQISERNVFS